MVGQDQLLGTGPVDDVSHPIVEIGRTPPRDGDAAHTQASPALHLREWLPTAVHRALFLQKRLGRNDRGAKLDSTGVIARQPYECGDFSVKISFTRKKCAHAALRTSRAAWNPGIFWGVLSVDEWTVTIRRRFRESAPDRANLWSVDNGGQVDKVWSIFFLAVRARSARGEHALENPARQDGPAGDEAGEISDGVRARAEELHGLVGRIDTAGRDDLELAAERAACAAQIRQPRR